MRLYAELWNARPAWLALSLPERERFFEAIGAELARQLDAGCEFIGAIITDTDTPHRAAYQYMALWRMDEALVHPFEEAWERLGCYTCFEQTNVRGTPVDAGTLFAHHIQAS
jgi:hypothetical protein